MFKIEAKEWIWGCLLQDFPHGRSFCSSSLLVNAHFSAQSVGGRRGGDISSPLDGGPQPGRGCASYRPVALPQPPAGGARRWWAPSATGESLPPRSRRRGWWTQSEAGDWRRRSARTSCPSPQPLGRLLVRSIISLPLPPTDHLEYATSFWCHIALSIGKYKIMKLRYAWVCAKSRTT